MRVAKKWCRNCRASLEELLCVCIASIWSAEVVPELCKGESSKWQWEWSGFTWSELQLLIRLFICMYCLHSLSSRFTQGIMQIGSEKKEKQILCCTQFVWHNFRPCYLSTVNYRNLAYITGTVKLFLNHLHFTSAVGLCYISFQQCWVGIIDQEPQFRT